MSKWLSRLAEGCGALIENLLILIFCLELKQKKANYIAKLSSSWLVQPPGKSSNSATCCSRGNLGMAGPR